MQPWWRRSKARLAISQPKRCWLFALQPALTSRAGAHQAGRKYSIKVTRLMCPRLLKFLEHQATRGRGRRERNTY